jgi:ribose transport system permease protein
LGWQHPAIWSVSPLGDFSLGGGEGSVVGVVLGAILLQVFQNLVNLLGIPSSLNFAVSGSIILNGVLADQEFADFREHRERRRRLAAGGAGAPPEAAIQADDRIADTDWAF